MALTPINDTDNLTIGEILRYSLEERKGSRFNATSDWNIGIVKIDGYTFTDYSAFSFIWEKSYIKSPERSGDGTISNLDSYATFVTPHLKIDFSMMSIDSYRKLMNLIYTKNEFLVTCYDVVNNRRTTNRMYFTTEEMPKLWTIARALNGEEWVELLGVQDYVVEMVGTNVSTQKVKVNYYGTAPDGTGQATPIHSEDFTLGEELLVGANVTVPTYDNYEFDNLWEIRNADGSVLKYLHKEAYRIGESTIDTLTNTIDFYAVFKPTTERTLYLNYGIGNPYYDEQNIAITSLKFAPNTSIATILAKANKQYRAEDNSLKSLTALPISFPAPFVKKTETINGEQKTVIYEPYERKGWYRTSSIGTGSVALTNSSVIEVNANTTIYQIYEPKTFIITYESNGGTYFAPASVKYAETVDLPNPYKAGFVFDGWYTTSNFKDGTAFSGSMPPYDITLYAKWK